MKRLDKKLARIRAGQYTRSDFIIADAKDGDMGSGCTTPAPARNRDGSPAPGPRRLQAYLDQIKAVVEQDIVDIMLMSASNLERMAEEGVFRDSRVQPAIRANEATDCWGGIRGGTYATHRSRPFGTAKLPRVMHGTLHAAPGAPITGTDLGLYSLTFNNDLDSDLASLEAFARFRDEAAETGSATSWRCSTRTRRAGSRRRTFPPSSTTTSCARWRESRARTGRSS